MHEAVGMSYAQYINLRDGAKDARSGKPRGMRKETAWRFENAGMKTPAGSPAPPLLPKQFAVVPAPTFGVCPAARKIFAFGY